LIVWLLVVLRNSDELNRRLAPTRLIFVAIRSRFTVVFTELATNKFNTACDWYEQQFDISRRMN